MALTRERKRSAEGEGKEEERESDESMTSNNVAGLEILTDAPATDWTTKKSHN